MKRNHRLTIRAAIVMALMLVITLASSRLRADSGTCGGAAVTLPFTDVMGNLFFRSGTNSRQALQQRLKWSSVGGVRWRADTHHPLRRERSLALEGDGSDAARQS